MNTISKTPIEICIPRVDKTITKTQIFEFFKKLKIGYIIKIIENPLKNEPTGKRILIRIDWNNSEKSINIQDRLIKNEPVQLVYQFPFYWKLVANQPYTK
jgi:signal transduction histidine kinase